MSPPGSLAVTVRVAVPTAAPVIVTVSPLTVTPATASSELEAA